MGDVRILALGGELDRADLPGVRDRIDSLIHAGDTRLVLNLGQLRFVSSSAISYLIRTAKRVRRMGGEVVLSEAPSSFRATAETLGLDKIVRICPTDEDALRHLGGDRGDEGGGGRPATLSPPS